jgi:hypothetical protein
MHFENGATGLQWTTASSVADTSGSAGAMALPPGARFKRGVFDGSRRRPLVAHVRDACNGGDPLVGLRLHLHRVCLDETCQSYSKRHRLSDTRVIGLNDFSNSIPTAEQVASKRRRTMPMRQSPEARLRQFFHSERNCRPNLRLMKWRSSVGVVPKALRTEAAGPVRYHRPGRGLSNNATCIAHGPFARSCARC